MDFISILSIFVLACFVGYYVVWSVTPALHTPLMAVTNAISSVIIVGALIAAAASGSPEATWLGLSSPATSQRGNRQGMVGMAIAVATTLLTQAPIPPGALLPKPSPGDLRILFQILAAIALGGAIGIVTARRIAMTAMPQLVAAFHSLVG